MDKMIEDKHQVLSSVINALVSERRKPEVRVAAARWNHQSEIKLEGNDAHFLVVWCCRVSVPLES
jgi:hypothetical protein